MQEQSPYAAANHVPFIKSPSLRIPRPVEAPQDIHPLPDDVNAYFVYPFTLEPHVLTLESSRRSTLAAHAAKHEAYLKQRAEDKERRKREALRRIAPGFEPSSGPLVPTKLSEGVKLDSTATGLVTGAVASSANTSSDGAAPARKKDVMEDLVDHLAALDAVNGNTSASRENIL